MNTFNSELFNDIFKIFNIDCNNEEDLFNITLDMDNLKDPQIINKLIPPNPL